MTLDTTKPLPPVPPDLDMSGFPWMPLDSALVTSDLFEKASPDAFRAAVGLWCLAWRRVPASSLPGDEKQIAALIGLSPQKWKIVREAAMAGFIVHADGRFYHQMIAEQALEVAKKRQRQRERSLSYWSKQRTPQLPLGGQVGDNLLETVSHGSTHNRSGPVFLLPAWIDSEDWKAFEEHRRVTMKAPLTDRARDLAVAKLLNLDPEHKQTRALINLAIEKRWLTFYPPKDGGGAQAGRSGLEDANADAARRFGNQTR